MELFHQLLSAIKDETLLDFHVLFLSCHVHEDIGRDQCCSIVLHLCYECIFYNKI